MPKKTKRKYDASRRREQARQTRLRIAAAARKLFSERGYSGATIEAIATQAGVAKETVYAIFKNKHNILSFLLDISIGGDDQRIGMLERPQIRDNLKEKDRAQQLLVFGRHLAGIMERAAPVFEITRIAAKSEPVIARRLERLYRDRLKNLGIFVDHVIANGPLRPGLDRDRAAEIVWGLSSAELFQLFREHAGWSPQQYAAWLGESLQRLLLP